MINFFVSKAGRHLCLWVAPIGNAQRMPAQSLCNPPNRTAHLLHCAERFARRQRN